MVAEGAFCSSLARRDSTDERELRLGDEAVRVVFERSLDDAYFFSGEHGSEDEFGHVFWQRRDRREHERGRAA